MNLRRRGFTLIEVLVVTAILSVTLVVLYSSFQIGMAAYKQTERNLNENREGEIFLFQFSQELAGAFPYLKSAFLGKDASVSFPTELMHYTAQGTERGLYVVTYQVDEGSLVRIEKKLRREKLREESPATETLFEHLTACQFEYLVLDGDEHLKWTGEWPNEPYTGLPRALRLKIAGASFGSEAKTYEILIPHGVLLQVNS